MKRIASTTLVTCALVALLAGAGWAAAAPPANTAEPAISGTPAEGTALTVSTGTWTGTGTLTYTYQWLRCRYAGSPCTIISGATTEAYTLVAADVGSTIRAIVTAKDSNGSNSVTAAATTAVTGQAPAGATTLPDGKVSVPATSVIAPHRLVIDTVQAPALARAGTAFLLKIHVSDTRGYVIGDVTVQASSVPKARALAIATVKTTADGWATLKVTPAKAKKSSVLFVSVAASYSIVATTGGDEEDDDDAEETAADEVTPLLLAERIVRIPVAPPTKRG